MSDTLVLGRTDELTVIIGALDDLPRHGAALLLRGEAGIGKSVLLDAARRGAEARAFTTLATAGVETETGLPYAGLHRLLRPLLGEIDVLGELQRNALRAALGLGESGSGDPFLVAIAVLELLTARAATGPVLLIADDAHWLDGASRTVLGFVGRRVGDRRIMLLAAMRDGYDETAAELRLPELALGGLDPEAAAEILDLRAPGLTTRVRRRLLAEAAGNPLALVELPAPTTTDAAEDADASVLPISTRLERAFASRLGEMPATTRILLLVAAADEASRVDEILAAGTVLGGVGVSRSDLSPAIDAGLISLEGESIHYRHPLVRSAIYQSAPLETRLVAHAALAQALGDDLDRRAWHRAAATIAFDDDVAHEVEAVARRAQARGAALDAAATLRRAAGLTANVELRAQRLLGSAELAFEAGRTDLVRVAVEEAQRLALGVRDRARAELLSEIFYDGLAGDVSRVETLVADAREVASLGDTDLALDLLRGAAVRCWWAALDAPIRAHVLAAADELPASPLEPRLLAIIACVAPCERGAEIVARAPEVLAAVGGDPLARWFVAMAAHAVGDHALSLEILAELAPVLRDHGRFGLLTQVLSMMQWDAALIGEWDIAEETATEGDRLAQDTGQRVWGAGITCGLSAVAAIRGDLRRSEYLAAAAERVIVPHGLADMHSVLLAARGVAAVAAGRHDDAFAVLRRAFDSDDRAYHYREQFGALSYLAEAASECGREPEGRAVAEALAVLAGDAAAPALRAAVSFAMAILADDVDADEHYRRRLADDPLPRPFQRARLHLAYGARLARQGRAREARDVLSLAHEDFLAVGAVAWACRADEVMASLSAPHPARHS